MIPQAEKAYLEWMLQETAKGMPFNKRDASKASLQQATEEAAKAVADWRDPYILKGSENSTTAEQAEYGEYVKRGCAAAIRQLKGEGTK